MAIRSHHPEVPQVVIVVASGSDPRSRRLNLGHFAAGRWQVTSPHQSTDRPEVLVSGEGLHAARSTSWACSCMRPAGTATRPCCFSYPARYRFSTASALERGTSSTSISTATSRFGPGCP